MASPFRFSSHLLPKKDRYSPCINNIALVFPIFSSISFIHPNFHSSKMGNYNMTPIVCLLIMVLDIVAGMLGIEAEIAQNKVDHLKMWIFECRDPSYKAFKLGMVAAVLMAFAHIIANLLGGCVCVWSKEEFDKATANQQLSVASLIFSWIILVIGFSMLVSGALSNSRSRQSCGISHHRLLSIGGILCFIHGFFSIAYYISATASIKEAKNHHASSTHAVV